MITSLPNLLTLSRIVAIPALVGSFYLAHPLSNWVGLGIFALAGITDFLDGHLARSRNEESFLGRFLDPIADKLLVAATLMMLVFVGRIGDWSVLPAVVILCREILVSGLREFLAEIRVSVPVSQLAKWKTLVQMLAIGFLIVGEAGWDAVPVAAIGTFGLWLAALLTLYTGYDYLRAGLRYMTADDAGRPSKGEPGSGRQAGAGGE
jgi:cardiolipin synthase